jgi:hemerythrin
MNKIAWSKDLTVGVDVIDEQHRQWIQRFNAVAAAIAAHQGPVQIGKILEFLMDYTKLHFATEEKLMAEHGYPDLPVQRTQHMELTDTLQGLLRDFEEEGATQKLAEAFNVFLGNWLIKHIRELDLKFGAFLKAHPA